MKVNNVEELRQHIRTVWDELDLRIMDKAIKWRKELALRPKVATLITNFKD